MTDSFQAKSTLKVGPKSYTYFDLTQLEAKYKVSRLPYSYKVLLENLLRHEDGVNITKDTIAALAKDIGERLPQVRAHWRDKLEKRLSDIDQPADAGRIEQEIVIFAQRMDVDEELTRLDSHLAEFRAALDRREPVGRRLDFLMQEFNREANTLASKSQDPDVTRLGVDMKVAIEQMREQVQNIE